MLITLGLAATDPKGGSQMVSNIVKGINRPTDWGLVKAELHVWMLSMTSTHVFFISNYKVSNLLTTKVTVKNLWHCVIPKKWRWKDKPFVKYGFVYCNIWYLTQFFHNLDKRLFAIKTVSAFDSFTTVLKLNALNVQNYTLYVVNFTIAKGSQYPLKQVQRIISTQTHLIKS